MIPTEARDKMHTTEDTAVYMIYSNTTVDFLSILLLLGLISERTFSAFDEVDFAQRAIDRPFSIRKYLDD